MADFDAARRAQHLVEPGAVALGDAAPRLVQRRLGQRQRRQHLAREAQVAEIDRRARQPDRGERLDRERDHLGVAVGPGQARQLDAGLDQLALAAAPRGRAARPSPRSRGAPGPS